MVRAFIGVGSNIEPADNVRKAVRLLAAHVRVAGVSAVYLTRPEGRPGQPPYYNCVAEIETNLPPAELKRAVLRRIEDDLGRVRTADKFAPRTIDLDLIVYDDLAVDTGDLVLPDPLIRRRPFLAIPLAELAPEMVLPGGGMTVGEIAAAMPRGGMKRLDRYTKLLRDEIRLEMPRL